MGGRYFYINDGGTIWSPGWSPVKTEWIVMNVVMAWGILQLLVRENDVSANVTFFVPKDYNGEVQKLVLRMKEMKRKLLSFFIY